MLPGDLERINERQRELERLTSEMYAEEDVRLNEWRAQRAWHALQHQAGVRGGEDVPEDVCDFVPTSEMRGERFVVKDSGAREEFESGMRRDTEDGKPDFTLIRKGPMFVRWAVHMTKGAVRYGRHNWTKANSEAEYERFKRSAARHFEQWLAGERDEDHAAAVMFNIDAAEYVLEQL